MKTPEHGPSITNNLRVHTYTLIQTNEQTKHTLNNNKKERIIPGRKYKPNATGKEEKK